MELDELDFMSSSNLIFTTCVKVSWATRNYPSISRQKEKSWQIVVTFVSFAALMELHTTFGTLRRPRPGQPQELKNFADQL